MQYVGGCQCGKVRYAAEGPRDRASVCYCRMCQKASGGPFMAFIRFPAERVRWSGSPGLFASSNFVERGFCRDCGTPLSYRNILGPNVSVTLNSLDEPGSVRPEQQFSRETADRWCFALEGLPVSDLDMVAIPDFKSFQR